MASKAGYPLETFSEEYWITFFSKPRRVYNNKPFIDIPKDGSTGIDDGASDEEDEPDDEGYLDLDNDEGNELDIFFAYPRDIASRCVVEKLEDYCKRSKSPNSKCQGYPTDKRKAVWFDDRVIGVEMKGPGESRQFQNPMDAEELCQALKKSQVTNGDTPNAARRLIYAIDPGPDCVEALAKTVSYPQVPVLRTAVHEYLECKSSIEVKIPSDGWLTFELNLHLSFFFWRNTPPKQSEAGGLYAKPSREWIDLSFLNSNVSGKQNQKTEEVCGLYQGQFSCVVTGSGDWQWVAYCFVDSIIDSEADLIRDPISAGILEAARPIWKPREYWIKIFEIRIGQYEKEWKFLIPKIEFSVNQYRKAHTSILFGGRDSERDRNESIKRDFEWNLKTIILLSQLDCVLSSTIASWDSFCSSDGQINLFCEIPHQRTKTSVDNIKATFRLLQGYRDQILRLKKCCYGFSKALKHSLSIESKAAADQTGATSEFMALVLYPVALAAAIFSMQVEVIPLKPSKESFWLVVFVLIVVTYLIRFVIRHAPEQWLSWQKVMGLRNKVEQPAGLDIEETRISLLHKIRSLMGLSSDIVKHDLELNDLGRARIDGLETVPGTISAVATPSKAVLRS